MLQEMELHKALKAFAAGRKVMALESTNTDPEEKDYAVSDLADWFANCRLLVDVPATINPEFEAAAQEMDAAEVNNTNGIILNRVIMVK